MPDVVRDDNHSRVVATCDERFVCACTALLSRFVSFSSGASPSHHNKVQAQLRTRTSRCPMQLENGNFEVGDGVGIEVDIDVLSQREGLKRPDSFRL